MASAASVGYTGGIMTWQALFILSLSWLPESSWDDLMHRAELAFAILAAEPPPHEARLLMRIARWESHYRRDVADCRITGDAGRSVGPWQAHDRSPEVRARICGSLVEAARVAIVDVRRSWAMCRHLPREERLAVYARGRCDSDEGRRLSRTRYVP